MTANTKYNFIKYTDFNVKTGIPTVGITKNNTFSISANFSVENNIERFKYAVLYYDKVAQSVGLKFTNDNTEAGRFTITRPKGSKSAALIAHSFFNKNSIPTERYKGKKYSPKKYSLEEDLGLDERGSMYVLDLNNPIE